MKRLITFIFILFLAAILFSAFVVHRITHGLLFSHGTSIHINESNNRFEINARYPERFTGRLREYIDARLQTDFFESDRYDESVVLGDDTKIYVCDRPGRLVIRLDKDENSEVSYLRIKQLASGIKSRLND